MLRRLLFLFAALRFAHTSLAADTTAVSKIADRIERVTFESRSFGGTKEYCVVLPANYDSRRTDWPVLYLLHGRGRNDRSLIDDDSTRAELLKANFVIVLPNGEDGWYLDSAVQLTNQYAKMLEETIADAESRYHLARDPKQRAIAGWSMGGYGAAHFAVTHPNKFAMLATILGLLDFPRSGLPAGQTYVVPEKTFGTDAAEWKKFNPLNAVEQLRGTKVVLITADRAFDRTMNENFRDRLQQLKIPSEWIVLKGEHHFDVVEQAVPVVIERVERAFDRTTVKEPSNHAK